MMIVYVLGAVAVFAIVWVSLGIIRIGAISHGMPIGDRSGTALLLIDLQTVFWDDGPYSDASKLATEAVILDEIRDAKGRGFPVVALRQEWSIPSTKAVAKLTMKGQAVEGTFGTEMAEPFVGLADHIVVKRVQDAFETGELNVLFEKLGVGKLRIVGLDFSYCVLKTALSARKRGYAVTIVKNGTLSAKPTERAERRMISAQVTLQ